LQWRAAGHRTYSHAKKSIKAIIDNMLRFKSKAAMVRGTIPSMAAGQRTGRGWHGSCFNYAEAREMDLAKAKK
jgi:hypothetical protein